MKNTMILFLIFVCSITLFAQVETVPYDDDVYIFLKEMKVKGVIESIHDDDPLLSRRDVKNLLEEIETKKENLNSVEKERLAWYQIDFGSKYRDPETTIQLFGGETSFLEAFPSLYEGKDNYLYSYHDSIATFFVEGVGMLVLGHQTSPYVNNGESYNFGFRFHGSFFDNLGYQLEVVKGMTTGNIPIAEYLYPNLHYYYKHRIQQENIRDHDYTRGYIRYETEPLDDFSLALQVGKEKTTFGFSYANSLIMSANHPDLDFIKFNLNYKSLRFTSFHASTVGVLHPMHRDSNYTKYIALNKLTLSFEDYFDIGIGEAIVYADRFEIGYLSPLSFYKFNEMALQDRDNGVLWFDFQTDFWNNFELQAAFFLDENILSNLSDLSYYANKTAYQFGAFWYEPFGFENLSLVGEYTKIRPYVYTHKNEKLRYSSFEHILGHPIGPNSDEIYLKAAYNANAWLRFTGEFRYIRSGENTYDNDGNLIRNVGGDFTENYHFERDNDHVEFLDGQKVKNTWFRVGARFEPFRDLSFELMYDYFYTTEENVSDREQNMIVFRTRVEY